MDYNLKKEEVAIEFDSLFFWMGAFSSPKNPDGFPDTFPFSLFFDQGLGIYYQKDSIELRNILNKTYAYGSTVGNAMDDSPLGLLYCEDFLNFIHRNVGSNKRILEIGAGRGYLTHRLGLLGFDVTAIEPGEINRPYWEKYHIEVIKDLFPSKKAAGPYDAIVFYGVLEHIADTSMFLKQVAAHLKPEGRILLSVPDCEYEIDAGDPGMLLHEHYRYFTANSLRRCLGEEHFVANIEKSSYGRTLYASAMIGELNRAEMEIQREEFESLSSFPKKCNKLMLSIQEKINKVEGSLGIYCPARALALLPHEGKFRFFDDSAELNGKFYPPFQCSIESRSELLRKPTDTLWIMSRTFGARLKHELSNLLPKANIFTVDELLS